MCQRNISWFRLARPPLGTWPATRHVPWPGIKPATFWFAGQHPTQWATPLRANQFYFCLRKILGGPDLTFFPSSLANSFIQVLWKQDENNCTSTQLCNWPTSPPSGSPSTKWKWITINNISLEGYCEDEFIEHLLPIGCCTISFTYII